MAFKKIDLAVCGRDEWAQEGLYIARLVYKTMQNPGKARMVA